MCNIILPCYIRLHYLMSHYVVFHIILYDVILYYMMSYAVAIGSLVATVPDAALDADANAYAESNHAPSWRGSQMRGQMG